MASQGIRKFLGIGRSLAVHRFSLPRPYGIYTPDYLELMKPKVPVYPLLNLQLKSFNYPVLEQFQKLVNVLVETFGADIESCWAFPPVCYKIQKFKPNSSAVLCEYELNEYQRHIQIEVSATQYPLILRAIEAALPEGVTVTVEYFNPNLETKRYVPDTELLKLKEDLGALQRK